MPAKTMSSIIAKTLSRNQKGLLLPPRHCVRSRTPEHTDYARCDRARAILPLPRGGRLQRRRSPVFGGCCRMKRFRCFDSFASRSLSAYVEPSAGGACTARAGRWQQLPGLDGRKGRSTPARALTARDARPSPSPGAPAARPLCLGHRGV